MYSIKCDTHTHTLYSRHAYSTIEENVRAAKEQGLELLATTDHFSSMLFQGCSIKDYQYLYNQIILPRTWHGVTVLHGVEADIIDLDGHLYGYGIPIPKNIVETEYKTIKDLEYRVLFNQDYVIASIHQDSFTKGVSLAKTTSMYCKVLEHPKVFILGHSGRSGVEFDLDEVLTCAKENHKLIEINEHSFEKGKGVEKRCRDIAIRCAELDVPVSLGSDAHVSFEIGKFGRVINLLEEIHFPKELIASRDQENFLQTLQKAIR